MPTMPAAPISTTSPVKPDCSARINSARPATAANASPNGCREKASTGSTTASATAGPATTAPSRRRARISSCVTAWAVVGASASTPCTQVVIAAARRLESPISDRAAITVAAAVCTPVARSTMSNGVRAAATASCTSMTSTTASGVVAIAISAAIFAPAIAPGQRSVAPAANCAVHAPATAMHGTAARRHQQAQQGRYRRLALIQGPADGDQQQRADDEAHRDGQLAAAVPAPGHDGGGYQPGQPEAEDHEAAGHARLVLRLGLGADEFVDVLDHRAGGRIGGQIAEVEDLSVGYAGVRERDVERQRGRAGHLKGPGVRQRPAPAAPRTVRRAAGRTRRPAQQRVRPGRAVDGRRSR